MHISSTWYGFSDPHIARSNYGNWINIYGGLLYVILLVGMSMTGCLSACQ